MQITDENGRQILCSQNADSLTGSLFEQLKQEKKLVFPDKELILHENGGTCFVWRKDIRQLQEVISMMKQENIRNFSIIAHIDLVAASSGSLASA